MCKSGKVGGDEREKGRRMRRMRSPVFYHLGRKEREERDEVDVAGRFLLVLW